MFAPLCIEVPREPRMDLRCDFDQPAVEQVRGLPGHPPQLGKALVDELGLVRPDPKIRQFPSTQNHRGKIAVRETENIRVQSEKL